MPIVRVQSFAVSLDGFAAGPRQDLENPIGAGGLDLMKWFFETRTWRQMHGLDIGDIFEARLVPLGRTWHFSTSFTYQPREVYGVIRREIKRRKKQGAVDARALVWELERMGLQHERFRNVSIDAIFNFETPFLSKRPRPGEAQQRGG